MASFSLLLVAMLAISLTVVDGSTYKHQLNNRRLLPGTTRNATLQTHSLAPSWLSEAQSNPARTRVAFAQAQQHVISAHWRQTAASTQTHGGVAAEGQATVAAIAASSATDVQLEHGEGSAFGIDQAKQDTHYVHTMSLKALPALTDTNLCPHFGRGHHRHSRGTPRASVAVFASCPVVCHFNTTMVELTLSSFFKHLHMPANTNVYVAHTPGGTPGCIAYEAMLRRWAEAYNSCYFISKSLPDAYQKVAEMTHDPYVLLLEHDWYLVPIKHTLQDLMRAMDSDPSINQIRFNQQPFDQGRDGPAIDITRAGVPLAVSPHHWSNNPAVVRTDFLRYRLSLIMEPEEGGSAGIEHPWIRKLGGKFNDTLISWFIAGLALYGHSTQSPNKYIVHLDTKATTCDYEQTVIKHMASLALPAGGLS